MSMDAVLCILFSVYVYDTIACVCFIRNDVIFSLNEMMSMMTLQDCNEKIKLTSDVERERRKKIFILMQSYSHTHFLFNFSNTLQLITTFYISVTGRLLIQSAIASKLYTLSATFAKFGYLLKISAPVQILNISNIDAKKVSAQVSFDAAKCPLLSLASASNLLK